MTMGFDVVTSHTILNTGFDAAWNTTPIPRGDAFGTGKTQPGARSLDASGALGLLLHYLNSTMHAISLQQVFVLIPSTVLRYITFGLKLLLGILRWMPDTAIQWPEHDDDLCAYNELIISWTAIAVKLNAPGSWHDSCVAQPIYEKLQTCTPEGFYLVADTTFPRVQGLFGHLRILLDIGRQNERGDLIEICVHSNNLRAQLVGINQIRSVYMPVWKENHEEEEIWKNFENMLFLDQHRCDRVARFRNIAIYES
ncbi:hypothetical protein C8R44DRAFT_833151 [Mycena epipterygia]|nr:hypothetical protein C8R44DRAFT_833151 [Mycena epipterygia]